MATMSVRIPDSLHSAIKHLAEKDGYSMNQFLITAAAEKVSSLETVEYLRERAARGNFEEFDKVMKKIPNLPPIPGDELPANFNRTKSTN